jgi:hypothetical protein
MPTSDEDLIQIHEANETLRRQIADARSAREQARASAEGDTRAAALLREQADLQAQLNAELEGLGAEIDVAVTVAEVATEPPKTAYQQMMEDADAANKAAQAAADEKVRRDALTPEERKQEDDEAAAQAAAESKPVDTPAPKTEEEAAAQIAADAAKAAKVVKPADPPSDPPKSEPGAPKTPSAPTNGKGK